MSYRNFFLLLCLCFHGHTAQAEILPSYITFPANVDWMTLKSQNFQIIYRDGNQALAKKAIQAAEKAHQLLLPIFKEAPEKTWIVLADFQDALNGYAFVYPYPHFVVFAAPPEANGQLSALDSWLESVILHEYVHVLHLYPAKGIYGLLRTVFGSWVVPNGLLPSHLHEGLATFLETELTEGGRGRSSYFSMLTRTAVREKVWEKDFAPIDLFNGSILLYPHGTLAYYFGEQVYREAYHRKGYEGIYRLVELSSHSWPYLVSIPYKDVLGVGYAELWESIFQKTKNKIENEPKTKTSKLQFMTSSFYTKEGLSVWEPRHLAAYRSEDPNGQRIEIRDYLSNKTVETLNLSGTTSDFCWVQRNKNLWLVGIRANADNLYIRNGIFAWSLEQKDLQNISIEPTSLGGGHHTLTCSEERIVTYHFQNGKAEVLAFQWKENKLSLTHRHELKSGDWVSSLLMGSEGVYYILREGGQTGLYYWNYPSVPKKITSLPAHAYSAKWIEKDTKFSFVSPIDNRDELWTYHLRNGQIQKIVPMDSGINSAQVIENQALVLAYRHGGYDIAWAELEVSTPKIPKASNHSKPEVQVSLSKEESYSAWPTVYPRGWIPSVFIVPNGVQLGAFIPGFDLSQKHNYQVFAGYDSRGSPFAIGDYTYRFGNSWSLHPNAYFLPSYIIAAQTFLKRWGGTLQIGSGTNFRWNVGPTFRKLEDNPYETANPSIGVSADLAYSLGVERKPLDVSPSRGIRFSISHQQYLQSLGSRDNYFSTTATIENYWNTFWASRHFWYISLKGGYTEGTSLINNFFQGGGELIFTQGREFFLNRGFLPGSFLGRRMATLNLEYRFPLFWVERGYGLWPLFLKRVHAALVSDVTTYDFGALSTRSKDIFKIFYASAGVELKSNWTLLFYLPSQIRLGFYRGFGDYGEPFYFTFGFEAGL